MKHHPGWDFFTPDAGAHETMKCEVCSEPMEVERGVNSATTRGEAAVHKTHLHDEFKCQNAGTDWHNQVLALKIEMKKTASSFLSMMLLAEIKKVLKTKIATKKVTLEF